MSSLNTVKYDNSRNEKLFLDHSPSYFNGLNNPKTVAVKDNIAVNGFRMTCGSRILEDFYPNYDATVISRLGKYQYNIIGKTNMDEFGLGSSGENSAFGSLSNPLDDEYVPGGSSSGSAVAVASDKCSLALGSDTGGSVRQPAAFCGIIGFKPSYGALSRSGLVSFAPSLDQIGILSKSTDGIINLFNTVRGLDDKDETSVAINENFFDNNNYKIASFIPDNSIISKPVKHAVNDFISNLEADVKKINLKYFDYWLSAYMLISASELSSNLARFTNLIYGNKNYHLAKWSDHRYLRSKLLGREVKRRIMTGTYALSRSSYEKYYLSAKKAVKQISLEFKKIFSKYDFLIMPATPSLPFKKGELIDVPVKMYYSDCLTVGANLAGLPAISIPYKEKTGKFYPGIQIIADKKNDLKLLDFIKKLEHLCRR